MSYNQFMKTPRKKGIYGRNSRSLTVRLPEQLASDLEREAEERDVTVSDVLRECAAQYRVNQRPQTDTLS